MHIAVGTLKRYKLDAVALACGLVVLDVDIPPEIHAVCVESGVPDQPVTNEESIEGARNRARQALAHCTMPCDLGIGIENGLEQVAQQWFATTWIVVVDRDGNEGVASALFRPVPPVLMDLVGQGHELSQAIAKRYGALAEGQDSSLIELLTHGALDKRLVLRDGVVTAMSALLNRSIFEQR